jgi:hypothetical protein
MKEMKLKGIMKTTARKAYKCECHNPDCPEMINSKETYLLMKIEERQFGERLRETRKISKRCSWWKQYEEFYKDIVK